MSRRGSENASDRSCAVNAATRYKKEKVKEAKQDYEKNYKEREPVEDVALLEGEASEVVRRLAEGVKAHFGKYPKNIAKSISRGQMVSLLKATGEKRAIDGGESVPEARCYMMVEEGCMDDIIVRTASRTTPTSQKTAEAYQITWRSSCAQWSLDDGGDYDLELSWGISKRGGPSWWDEKGAREADDKKGAAACTVPGVHEFLR